MEDKTSSNASNTRTGSGSTFSGYDLAGTTLGGYRLVRRLAEGGMGVVYEAIQIKLDRRVALKVLTDQLSSRAEFLKRFEREAKAAAALNHPGVVQVHDFGEADGRHYIIMEFVEGQDLSEFVETNGKFSIEEALNIIEHAAHALKAACEKSIIHRDIKPSNLMLTNDGRVKVSDLGLAKILTENTEVTATGIGIGSPYFIAPEQANDASSVDHRVDIYSLGITLMYLLTGRKPFDGNTPYSIVLAHVNKPLPSGAELGTELPQEVDDLIQRMAAKNPDDRYQTYDELISDLQRVKAGFAPAAPLVRGTPAWRSKKVLAGAGVTAIVIAASAIFLSQPGKKEKPPERVATTQPPTLSPATTPASMPDGVNSADTIVQLDQGQYAGRQEEFRRPPPGGERRGPREGGQQFEGRRGGGGEPGELLLPMGPPTMPNRYPLDDAPLASMLQNVQRFAADNPSNYVAVINAYRQVRQKAAGSRNERELDDRINEWIDGHNRAAKTAIVEHTAKMNEHLRAGDPHAAFNSWSTFPSNLRSREIDEQISGLLQQSLPAGFSPARN